MGLPESRDVTLGTSTKFPPSLGNALQDMIIGSKRKAFPRPFWPKLIGQVGTWTQSGVTVGGGSFSSYIISGAGGTNLGFVDVPFEEGDRIIGLTVCVSGNGVANCNFSMFYTVDMVFQSSLTNTQDLARTATWTRITIPITPQIIAPGGGLILGCQSDAASYRVGLCRAIFDRL